MGFLKKKNVENLSVKSLSLNETKSKERGHLTMNSAHNFLIKSFLIKKESVKFLVIVCQVLEANV